MGTSAAPSPATSMRSPGSSVTAAVQVSHSPSASPMESNPGPRLALLAGTRTRTEQPGARLCAISPAAPAPGPR